MRVYGERTWHEGRFNDLRGARPMDYSHTLSWNSVSWFAFFTNFSYILIQFCTAREILEAKECSHMISDGNNKKRREVSSLRNESEEKNRRRSSKKQQMNLMIVVDDVTEVYLASLKATLI